MICEVLGFYILPAKPGITWNKTRLTVCKKLILNKKVKIMAFKIKSNRYYKGFTLDLPHICILRMEAIYHPYFLFRFKFVIIRSI